MDLMKTRLFISIESKSKSLAVQTEIPTDKGSDYGNMLTLWPMTMMGKNEA